MLWFWVCRSLRSPRIFGDEVNYWNYARCFHAGHRLPYWSIFADVPSQLFSLILSPVFFCHGLWDAYHLARILTALLMAAAVFPAYLLARCLLDRRGAALAALLCVVVPSMVYNSMIMTENLFYPLFIGAFYAGYRALLRGKVWDGLVAGILFAAAFYTKPHLLVLAVAYLLCTMTWAVARVLSSAPANWRSILSGFARRLVPVACLAAAILPRAFLSEVPRESKAVLFGASYVQILTANHPLDMTQLLTAWSGLVLITLLGTAFVPFAVFVASASRLRRMEERQQWFWLLAAFTWLGYTALAARHTVLADAGVIRIHERYIFVCFPPFFVWSLFALKQLSRTAIVLASVTATLCAAVIIAGPGRIFMTPHVNSDSPSLTLLLEAAWHRGWSYAGLTLLVIGIGSAATLAALSGRQRVHVAVSVMLFAAATFGWIEFEKQWISPLHDRLDDAARDVASTAGPDAKLGLLYEGGNWLWLWHCDFWQEQPTILYGVDQSTELPSAFSWTSNVRAMRSAPDGKLLLGEPAPAYLLVNSQTPLPLPLTRWYPLRNGTMYLYRVPHEERDPKP